jgi:O-acetylserine/cysteine efflux transporter
MSLRFLLVLVVLLPFLRLPPPGQWGRMIFVCLCIGALHFTTLFWAISRSQDLSSIAIIQQTYIPMSLVLAMLFLGERMGWRSLLGVAVAFGGVVVLSFDPLIFSQRDVLLIALAASVFQALGSVFMRGIHGVGAVNFQAWTALISLPLLIIASLLFEEGQIASLSTASALDWAAVSYSGLVSSIVGYGLFFLLVQRNPVTTIMPYMLLMPLIAIFFGVLVWGDRPGIKLLFGGVLVMAGILYITLRARQKGPAA